MLILLTYLAIGTVFMTVVVLRRPYSTEPDGMVKAVAGGVSLFDKILAAFVTPFFGCLFGVAAWPVLLIWKAQDMRSTREGLVSERDFQQPKFGHHGNPLIHPRIDGKIVTHEEWDAARLQTSGVPGSVTKAISAGVIQRASESSK